MSSAVVNPIDTLIANLRTSGLTEAVKFAEGNYGILAALGLAGIQEVLEALQRGDNEAAQNALDKNMTTEELIEAQLQNADNKQQATAKRAAFLNAAASVVVSMLPVVVKLAGL